MFGILSSGKQPVNHTGEESHPAVLTTSIGAIIFTNSYSKARHHLSDQVKREEGLWFAPERLSIAQEGQIRYAFVLLFFLSFVLDD